MATEDLIKVLYTHQKTKKWKTWQDGFVTVYKDKKVILLDEKKAFVSSFSCPASKLVAGEEIETARYLITIDEVISTQPPPAKKPCAVRPRGPPLSRPKVSYSVPARSDCPATGAVRPAAVVAAGAPQRTLPRQLLAMAKGPNDMAGASVATGHCSPARRQVAEMSEAGQSERCAYSAGQAASQQPDSMHSSVRSSSSFASAEVDQGRGTDATRELDRGCIAPSVPLYRPGECRPNEPLEVVADHSALNGGRPGSIQELDPPVKAVTNLSASRPDDGHSADVLPPSCTAPINRSASEIIALIRGAGRPTVVAVSQALT